MKSFLRMFGKNKKSADHLADGATAANGAKAIRAKPRFNRETLVGLSILLVLLITLGAVLARRFFRPHERAETIVAMEEARLGDVQGEREKHEHEKHDLEWPRKPELLTPVAAPHREDAPSLDDPSHWSNAPKEKREETRFNPTVSSSIPADPPIFPKPRGDHERMKTEAPSGPSLGEDHHLPAAEAREKGREFQPTVAGPTFAAGPAMGSANSMVVQVSGDDGADRGPRSPEHYAGTLSSRPEPRARAELGAAEYPRAGQPGALSLAAPDAPAAGMPFDSEAARKLAEQQRGEQRRAEEHRSEEGRMAGDAAPRYGYSAAGPTGNVPPNYGGYAPQTYAPVQGGYAAENSRRTGGDVVGPLPIQNPLRGDGKYEVQPNDSFWTISEKVYGSGAYFRALAEQNRGKAARPDRLPPGLVITTPPVAQLEKDYPDLCPRATRRETVRNRADALHGYPGATMASTAGGGRTYVVQEGDTLSSIARNELGKVSRWAEIYQLNRAALGRDFDYLTPGMRLVLPIRDAQPGDRTTRRDEPFTR